LLEYKEEEGESIEPKYFLPIIPTILLNGSSGIAVGFASNVLNRNIKDIIDAY
jgi:DNA topoisomerase-2